MGRFARLVQANSLLAMSLRVVRANSIDEEHIMQLDRTLKALSSLSASEAELNSSVFCVPHAVCVE